MPVHRPRNVRLPTSFPSRDRRQLREEALRDVSLNRGTNYPCTQSELRDATIPSTRPTQAPLSRRQASLSVQNQNALGSHVPQSEYNAVCRLEDAILRVYSRRQWCPDLIIKAFCDLDRVFFGGELRGHVFVQWAPTSAFPSHQQHPTPLGVTYPLQEGKAMIVLCTDGVFHNSSLGAFKQMWSTMLHEMW